MEDELLPAQHSQMFFLKHIAKLINKLRQNVLCLTLVLTLYNDVNDNYAYQWSVLSIETEDSDVTE